MVGVELVSRREGNVKFPVLRRAGAAVCRRLLSDGIWLRPLGDTVVIFPPAVISDADLRRVVRRLEKAIDHELAAA
jgi:adenosylmethionine-8-amino-7-oxononanoate aminotransferase